MNLSLRSILKKGEDSKTEFKESVSSSLDKEMVAFANSQGEKIYIGITDNGEAKGVKITNKLKGQIQNIAQNCDPKVSISFEEFKKEKILAVTVEESKEKPHRCSSGFYIRSGSLSQKLTTQEIRDFMIDEDLIDFDDVVCKKFDFKKHFDKEKLFSFLNRAKATYKKRNVIQLLENLELAQKQGSKVIFNNAGALLFSKNLEKIYPHTEISCGFFKGTEKVKVLDSARFNEDILSSIENAMAFLWKNLRARHELIHKTARRQDILEIPEDALREALVNAVTHRDYVYKGPFVTVEIYDDRVEISNYGGLPKGLSKKDFGKKNKSIPRNHLLARLMLRAKYIERMGSGIKKMRDHIKAENLPPIKFEFDNFFTIIFTRKPPSEQQFIAEIRPKFGNRFGNEFGNRFGNEFGIRAEKAFKLLEILGFIESGNFSISAFAKSQGITSRTVEKDLKFLKGKELILTEGSTRATKYKVTEKYKKLKRKL